MRGRCVLTYHWRGHFFGALGIKYTTLGCPELSRPTVPSACGQDFPFSFLASICCVVTVVEQAVNSSVTRSPDSSGNTVYSQGLECTNTGIVGSNREQTKFGECLLPFGSEYFVIPPAVQECKG
jgi:hypothetical protein